MPRKRDRDAPRVVHRTARSGLRVTRAQRERCFALLRSAGDVWSCALELNQWRRRRQDPPLASYQKLCRELAAAGPGTFGELDSAGARSVLRRYSDAWFATAKRRKAGDTGKDPSLPSDAGGPVDDDTLPRPQTSYGMPMATGYGRESMGSAQSINEQSRLFFTRAAAEGWEVKGWFEDKVSASSYGRKKGITRDAWPEVRANLTEILWLNESSRGDRELSQWAAFLEECRDGGARVWVESHERLFDLRIAADWRTLATDGVDSEMEARRISRRVRTGMDRNVREGRTHGRVPFGYTRGYEYVRDEDGKRQRVVIQELHPVQSLVVKEIYDRIRAGESLKSMARDLNARGIFLNSGKEWTESRVRSVAIRPLYMGKRIHNETPAKYIIAGQTILTDAQWPAIVDETLFWVVYNKLTDPSRLTHKPGGAKHLLSLIGQCGECNGPLQATARYDGGQWKYICRDKSCVMIKEAELDAYVMFEITRFLSDEKNYSQQSDNGQVQGMYAQISEKQAARERLGEAVEHGMDPVIAGKTDKRLALEMRELEAKIRDLTIPAILTDFAERCDDVAERLEEMTLAGKREIMRAVMERKGYVRLHRTPQGRQPGSVPAVDRVSWAA